MDKTDSDQNKTKSKSYRLPQLTIERALYFKKALDLSSEAKAVDALINHGFMDWYNNYYNGENDEKD